MLQSAPRRAATAKGRRGAASRYGAAANRDGANWLASATSRTADSSPAPRPSLASPRAWVPDKNRRSEVGVLLRAVSRRVPEHYLYLPRTQGRELLRPTSRGASFADRRREGDGNGRAPRRRPRGWRDPPHRGPRGGGRRDRIHAPSRDDRRPAVPTSRTPTLVETFSNLLAPRSRGKKRRPRHVPGKYPGAVRNCRAA